MLDGLQCDKMRCFALRWQAKARRPPEGRRLPGLQTPAQTDRALPLSTILDTVYRKMAATRTATMSVKINPGKTAFFLCDIVRCMSARLGCLHLRRAWDRTTD